jgi:hypothetical protein
MDVEKKKNFQKTMQLILALLAVFLAVATAAPGDTISCREARDVLKVKPDASQMEIKVSLHHVL